MKVGLEIVYGDQAMVGKLDDKFFTVQQGGAEEWSPTGSENPDGKFLPFLEDCGNLDYEKVPSG